MDKLTVFAPWLVVGLVASVALVAGNTVSMLAQTIQQKRAEKAAFAGRGRRYVVNFESEHKY